MSTPTRCLPEGQWVREAGSAHGRSCTTLYMEVQAVSTPTRCLPEGQWVREAGSGHGKSGETLAIEVRQ